MQPFLDYVYDSEKESIRRVSKDLLRNSDIEIETRENPKTLSKSFDATKGYVYDERHT